MKCQKNSTGKKVFSSVSYVKCYINLKLHVGKMLRSGSGQRYTASLFQVTKRNTS